MINKLTCGFNEAWVGKCKNLQPCKEHMDLECSSCGEPATRSCSSTGQFVCGAPLCDDCQHLIFPEGHNGGVGFNALDLPEGFEKRHIRKEDQPDWKEHTTGTEETPVKGRLP